MAPQCSSVSGRRRFPFVAGKLGGAAHTDHFQLKRPLLAGGFKICDPRIHSSVEFLPVLSRLEPTHWAKEPSASLKECDFFCGRAKRNFSLRTEL
jgi:hypothetical protein